MLTTMERERIYQKALEQEHHDRIRSISRSEILEKESKDSSNLPSNNDGKEKRILDNASDCVTF